MGRELMLGDCKVILPQIPPESIDSIVTDPPYELGFMGKKWDASGIAYDVSVWQECLRVLKPGGHLLSFGGSRTYHRMACAIEDAGFEIRDQIMWLYGSGFPKSRDIGDGKGTALKPAHEPIVLARKPIVGTVEENVDAYAVGALNIDACLVGDENGRWPANVIHDGSDEVLAAFPNAPGQQADVSTSAESRRTQNVYGAMKRGNEKTANTAYKDSGATNFAMKPGARRLDEGSAARFFYCAKATKKDRDEGLDKLPPRQYSHDGRDKRIENAYQRNDSVAKNFHPTVKPTPLMRYLVRLITPIGGMVLDPFMGSGSTGKGCMLERVHFTGIEIDPEYAEIAALRIDHVNSEEFRLS